MSVDVEGVVDRLLAAISAGDAEAVGALYADDMTVWHSCDNRDQPRAENLAVVGQLQAAVDGWRYEITQRVVQGNVLAQEHILHVTPKGSARSIPVPSAIFVTVNDDGRVGHIREYVDSSLAGGFSAG